MILILVHDIFSMLCSTIFKQIDPESQVKMDRQEEEEEDRPPFNLVLTTLAVAAFGIQCAFRQECQI